MMSRVLIFALVVRSVMSKHCFTSSLNWDWTVPQSCNTVEATDRLLGNTQVQRIGASLPSLPNCKSVSLRYDRPLPMEFLDNVVEARAAGSMVAVSTTSQSTQVVEAMISWHTRGLPVGLSQLRSEHDTLYTELKELETSAKDRGLNQSLIGEASKALDLLAVCGQIADDRVDAGYPGISKDHCLSKGDSCWDDTQSDIANCFYMLSINESVVDILQTRVRIAKNVIAKISLPMSSDLKTQILNLSKAIIMLTDQDQQIEDEFAKISVNVTSQSIQQLQAAVKILQTRLGEIALQRSISNIERRKEAELRVFHSEVFPRVCLCNAGCEIGASELLFRGWSWQAGYYRYNAGLLINANVKRNTLRAAFWMHILFDSVGVRNEADLELIEPWMLLKSNAYRDVDSTIQHFTKNLFTDKASASEKILEEKHLDAYYDFNTPLNTRKLLTCLQEKGNPIKEENFSSRGFVEVDMASGVVMPALQLRVDSDFGLGIDERNSEPKSQL